MPALYLVQQQTKIRIRNRRVQVERDYSPDSLPAEVAAGADAQNAHPKPEILLSVPLAQVEQVLIFGNVGLTTPAIDAFLAQNTEVIFLTQRGEYRGRLVGNVTPHVPLRRAQYTRLGEPDFVLAMAKCFVAAKLGHQRTLLMRHNRERGDSEIEAVVAQMRQAIEGIERKSGLASLLGVEGAATAAYFRGLRRLFDPRWKFDDRNRRPPRDPVNVLLSFGYTLLAEAAASAVQAVGLDPYAGFLHEVAYNRPALGLDLLEEFRPLVDGLALWCLNSGQLTLQDFTPGPPERPIILSQQGQRRFLQAYEQRLDVKFTHPLRQMQFPLRQCLIEQARQVAACITRAVPDFKEMGFR
ncbi:MAG: CRISPR-associated endonuclease Cas1 [Anaerolineales bacterium]|jgi:CRISPR-associated protein Cas1|nr:CRISPR-associated endonuclease Cas1 [Anaerolineales bacterium]